MSFLELVQKTPVEIPLLQRDYAQGRMTPKVISVRENLVNSMFRTLRREVSFLELDFIYGPITHGKFIPIDGQQRLTTLFLLFWYISRREEVDCPALNNFSYKVRTTTQEFLTALLDGEKAGMLNLEGENPKVEILDAPWYYSVWDNDPSIQGMLNMLDCIHIHYGNPKVRLWKFLDQITFHVLDMEGFGLSDDLYMKMNSRGVPLTEFENFKAWLEQEITSKRVDVKPGWETSLDREWTDLFWMCRTQESIDAPFLRYFKTVLGNVFASKINHVKEKSRIEKLQRLLNEDAYIPVGAYGDDYGITERDFLKPAFLFLDQMCKIKADVSLKAEYEAMSEKAPFFLRESVDLFDLLFIREKGLSYGEKILFHGLFLKLSSDTPTTELLNWMRVVRNLTLNTDFNTIEDFVDAVKGLTALFENSEKNHGVLESLRSGYTPKGFRKTQVDEEKRKAELLLMENDKEWFDRIHHSENLALLRGQVGFLLDFSNESPESFSRLTRAFEAMFCNEAGELAHDDGNRLQCALFVMEGEGESEYRLHRSTEDWRAYFRDKNSALSLLLQATLKKIDKGENDRRKLLEEVIEEHCPEKGWRRVVALHPELLQHCKRIRLNQNSGGKVYLLHSTNYKGRYSELLTLFFHWKVLSKASEFPIIFIHTGRGGHRHAGVKDDDHHLSLMDWGSDGRYALKTSAVMNSEGWVPLEQGGEHVLLLDREVISKDSLLEKTEQLAEVFRATWEKIKKTLQ